MRSPYYQSRKLLAVLGVMNGTPASQLLVDCGFPVTIIRADFWRQIRDLATPVENVPEDVQGVTRDGLHIIGITRFILKIGGLQFAHPVLIAESIAHKFTLGNDSHSAQIRHDELAGSYSIWK